MNEGKLEQNSPKKEIDTSTFNFLNKKIRTKEGLIIGAKSGINGTIVLIEKENGEEEVRPLAGLVSAANKDWDRIVKISKGPSSHRLANIRPPGRYSDLAE